MTDRELLELAAKAAKVDYGWQHIFNDYEGCTADKWDWNPITDDGDALRLAVKLRITPNVESSMTDCEDCTEAHLGDPYAATRRAITRAAAEIGRAMQ
jgi:hypothetical protein